MKLYPLKGVHEEYGISISMLKKLIIQGKLTVVKVGAKNFIKEQDIEDYIDRNTKEATNV
jgi:predicted site-specific integrase-resolvase